LTTSHIEFLIFNLFKIDVLNFIKVKANLAKDFHIQPSETDNMPAWEYELFMRELNNAIKEDNKRHEQESEGSNSDFKRMTNLRNIERMQKSAMSKSNMNNFKLPKI
jgi:hypothetical protein